ncbi:MarR family transcriptional regulator [Hoeflea sp. WL0058]|uniref:MarR family transcriptional regulator n=1 Tax=Flavimaribacter sediminis TaxID=2865987 RepID=A0AAE2ZNW2_9HYPH|nr:MarR family transcriptional regulator [Flavimaribacter sediminis]MBW8638131.1 MarR family transcriptional regulator [Flavimaribacter sediminis]
MGETRQNAVWQDYVLDEQVGFIMRRASQRHLGIFASRIPELTPTQFAALAKLCELGAASQNELGRRTAMDAATIKGVIDRLRRRGLVTTVKDANDQRRLFVKATAEGEELYASCVEPARMISDETLAPLSEKERLMFLQLLSKLQ